MLKLYQFPAPRGWQVRNQSPFCLKLETYLRLARIPYKNVICFNPRLGPKGKLPFIKDENLGAYL